MTNHLAQARAALSDPNTPQNLREILEAELGRPEEPDYAEVAKELRWRVSIDYYEYELLESAAVCIETLLRRCERLDQLWTEALGCAARSMERVRELEEPK